MHPKILVTGAPGTVGSEVAKSSFIDARDISAVAAQTLLSTGHEQRIYTLTGAAALDYHQVAAEMSAVLGRPCAMTLVMAGLYTITRWGNASAVTEDVRQVLGRPPRTFHQFVCDYQACWLPQTEAT